MVKSRCLVTTVTHQNCIYRKFKSRFNSVILAISQLRMILSFRLLYKNIKIKKYENLILSVAFRTAKFG